MEWRRPLAKLESSEYSWSTEKSHTPAILSRMRRIFGAPRMPPTPSTTVSRSFREVFGRKRRNKIFEMIVFIAAIDSVKFSSKSELSSRFFGRLKFSGSNFSETLNGRLPLEDGSDRRETLPKRVSDNSRRFNF